MTRSILVTGSNGQLGSELAERSAQYPQDHFTFVDKEQLDLSDTLAIQAFLQKNSFDLIINCAAHTAVDLAESQQTLSDQLNHLAVKQLAQNAKQQNSTLIHISTDYVFNGKGYKPYCENDSTDPINTYGATKLKGEQAVLAINPKGLIIRTSWVYSSYGANFVKTMLKLGAEREQLNIINDQVGSPTYAADLAEAILSMINHPDFDTRSQTQSIYHYSNEGVCSWYDFAHAIFEIAKSSCKISTIETKDYPTVAKRPHYSVMNKSKIRQQWGISTPHWRDALKTCLNKINKGSMNTNQSTQ